MRFCFNVCYKHKVWLLLSTSYVAECKNFDVLRGQVQRTPSEVLQTTVTSTAMSPFGPDYRPTNDALGPVQSPCPKAHNLLLNIPASCLVSRPLARFTSSLEHVGENVGQKACQTTKKIIAPETEPARLHLPKPTSAAQDFLFFHMPLESCQSSLKVNNTSSFARENII